MRDLAVKKTTKLPFPFLFALSCNRPSLLQFHKGTNEYNRHSQAQKKERHRCKACKNRSGVGRITSKVIKTAIKAPQISLKKTSAVARMKHYSMKLSF